MRINIQTRKNLIWFIVDSVRTFRTQADDRDRLDFMDEFGKESIEFLKAFASAPSSILSGAAMFTGMPSCFIARHFSDWQFDPEYILSLQDVLAQNGYTNYAIHNSKEDREVMRDLIQPISSHYFPKGISHGEWWTNAQLNLILENVLGNYPKQPAFYMLWYDCRRDPLVSEHVKQGMELFKKYGYYEDSVIVLTSDHGYPDPRTGLSQSTLRKQRHDMVVTDDNIQVPLFLRVPGIPPGKVHEMVGLVDLFPTLITLLGVECHDQRLDNVRGFDLTPLITGNGTPWKEERILRVDTRLTLAPGRVTALRTNTHKFVYYHDENIQSLYNLDQDPLELNDLLEKTPSKEIEELRDNFYNTFIRLQDELNKFHTDELVSTFNESIHLIRKFGKVKRLVLLSFAPPSFLQLITILFRSNFPGICIDLIINQDRIILDELKTSFDHVITVKNITPQIIKNAFQAGNMQHYDVALLITEQSSIGFDDPLAFKAAKIIGSHIILVDYNMKFYKRWIAHWIAPVRKYARNWIFYKQEPLLIIKDVFKLFDRGIKILILKQRPETPDMEKAKKMRDRELLANKDASAMLENNT